MKLNHTLTKSQGNRLRTCNKDACNFITRLSLLYIIIIVVVIVVVVIKIYFCIGRKQRNDKTHGICKGELHVK